MTMWNGISSQFGRPRGVLGKIAGFIMSKRRSNLERNTWALGLLELKATDNLLEIGFGPGTILKRASSTISDGSIYGIDHSELMVKQATRENIGEIQAGKIQLVLGSISDLPQFQVRFDKVLDVNSFQFWERQVEALINVRHQMKKGGRLVLVHQPRHPGATDRDSDESGKELSEKMKEAGFSIERVEIIKMKPISTVGIVGINI